MRAWVRLRAPLPCRGPVCSSGPALQIAWRQACCVSIEGALSATCASGVPWRAEPGAAELPEWTAGAVLVGGFIAMLLLDQARTAGCLCRV